MKKVQKQADEATRTLGAQSEHTQRLTKRVQLIKGEIAEMSEEVAAEIEEEKKQPPPLSRKQTVKAIPKKPEPDMEEEKDSAVDALAATMDAEPVMMRKKSEQPDAELDAKS